MKFRKSLLTLALLGAALPAAAQTYSKTVFFGDSLSDSGYFRPALIQIAGPGAATVGKFTTNPYLVWSEQLALRYGIQLNPSNQGGTNYAVGGARAGIDTVGALGPIPSVTKQVSTYLSANGGRADANALYSIWAGGNDMLAVLGGAPAQSTIGAAVTAEIQAVGALKAAGGQWFVVPNLPDLGLTPTALALGAAGVAQATGGAQAYNSALFGGLTTAGINFIPVDTFGLLREVKANAAAFGYTNTTGMACGAVSSLQCAPPNYVAPNASETYLFADGVHPTGKTQTIMADLAYSMLEGPRQVALAPHAALNNGDGAAATVFNSASLIPDGGHRTWVNVRGNYQNYDSSDLYKSNGGSVTAGMNFGGMGVTFGPFIGFGQQGNTMGHGGGSFDQTTGTVGGQLRASIGVAYVTAMGSYSQVKTDVERNVVLGPVTRVHKGSLDGHNVTLGAQVGMNIPGLLVRGGPFASVVSQRIKLDGYQETDPTLSTALGFDDMDVKSTKARLGWQVKLSPVRALQPYLSVAAVRELEDQPEVVTARALSTGVNYNVPGLTFKKNYGELNAGVRTQLFGLAADVGVTANVGEKDAQQANLYATFAF